MASSDIDVAAILAALRGFEDREPRQPNNRAIKDYLLRKGLSESIAKFVSMNELCFWTEKEVDTVFGQLHATVSDIGNRSLRSFSVQPTSAERADRVNLTDFVKPSWSEVEQSAKVLGALCVNNKGEFAINPPEGYAALSHVWAHGLGSDEKNRGLHRSLISQLFAKVAPLGVKWIWTDSLAIPGGGEELEVVEEEMKAALINAMADIYRKATQVIVLDALVLRFASVDPVNTAIILCCGRWMSRVWTYQEIKLATNSVVATKTGFVKFSSMVETLRSKAEQEAGEGYDSNKRGQFPSLYRTFMRLQRNDQLGVSLPDIAIGCGYREAFDKLDYARAVFPTLGVQWRFGDSIEDAMRKIYETQKRHAMRLVLFHGPPRASYPGWAPAVFPGLVDSKVIAPGTWKSRGMARVWRTSKVRSVVPSKPGCVILELDNGQSPGAYCLCYISEATKEQSPKSVELFEASVKSGTAYLLADEPLAPKQHFARVGILVEKFTKPHEPEAWVCLTLAIGETEESYQAEEREWLLLHENPASEKGKSASELHYMLERSSQPVPAGHQMESRLHSAAQQGDTATIGSLVTGRIDANQRDSRGWTPLHYAAAAGQASATRLLTMLGAHLATPTGNDETPLVLAVDNAHQDIVLELVEAGADVNEFAPGGPSPLVTAVRNHDIEMARLLLALQAKASLQDGYGFTPLMCAAYGAGDGSTDLLAELLEAGANAAAVSSSGLDALGVAAREGNADAARLLLARGVDPNGGSGVPLPPLQHAIEARSVDLVELLLKNKARASGVRFQGDQTPLMCAAQVGDVPIGRLLRKHEAELYAAGGKEAWTALHVAAAKGNSLFFKWVLEESKGGRDWHLIKDYKGRTAFQLRNGDE